LNEETAITTEAAEQKQKAQSGDDLFRIEATKQGVRSYRYMAPFMGFDTSPEKLQIMQQMGLLAGETYSTLVSRQNGGQMFANPFPNGMYVPQGPLADQARRINENRDVEVPIRDLIAALERRDEAVLEELRRISENQQRANGAALGAAGQDQ
jgi:hypothetical protein